MITDENFYHFTLKQKEKERFRPVLSVKYNDYQVQKQINSGMQLCIICNKDNIAKSGHLFTCLASLQISMSNLLLYGSKSLLLPYAVEKVSPNQRHNKYSWSKLYLKDTLIGYRIYEDNWLGKPVFLKNSLSLNITDEYAPLSEIINLKEKAAKLISSVKDFFI